MMTTTSELGFDCKPQILSMLMKSIGDQTTNQPTHNLEEFVARLEEERLKIDAFKRELPLCMQLLNNAMEASRQELQSQRSTTNNQGAARPVLEEFIPLKNTNSSEEETDNNISSDKANWMTSAQLWNQESDVAKTVPQSSFVTSPQEADINLALNGKHRVNGGGAFLPFSSKDRAFPELALAPSHKEEIFEDQKKCGNNEKDQVSGSTGNNNNNNTSSQNQRKARRCWSPDLHRRFVNALHMLGGSQGENTTPKQIRELMKVDGLTNDEVKSHLQKYRLHTRRPSPSPQAPVSATPQVVFLGGIWVPPEYAAAAAAAQGGTPMYTAHAPTTHHVAQEMYPTLPGPSNHQMHLHHQMQHQQFHVYNKAPLTNSPPRSGGDGGDPSESIEDGKSQSSSWKADSGGDNGGDRRRLECDQESNASAVTLKF